MATAATIAVKLDLDPESYISGLEQAEKEVLVLESERVMQM